MRGAIKKYIMLSCEKLLRNKIHLKYIMTYYLNYKNIKYNITIKYVKKYETNIYIKYKVYFIHIIFYKIYEVIFLRLILCINVLKFLTRYFHTMR